MSNNIDPNSILGRFLNSGILPTNAIQTVVSQGNPFGSIPPDYNLSQDTYDFTQRVFPSNLGADGSYNGHYMVININVQDSSQMGSITTRAGTNLTAGTTQLFTRLNDQLSKTDVLRYNLDSQFSVNGQSLQQGFGTRPRFTRRIKESIALYMPNSEMTFTDSHDFENISLTKFATGILGGIVEATAVAIGAAVGGISGSELGPAGTTEGANLGAQGGAEAGKAINNAVGAISGAVQVFGAPINPKVELLYANTFQRQFGFDFLFAPISEAESLTLQQIIRTLRFHAAPELRPGVADSFFWVPPSEFDITFYDRGKENTAIPRINTCILNQIDISYSPTGTYATFSNGYPVQVRMMLRFTETEIISKTRILDGM